MKANIRKLGMFSYRWQVGHVYSFTLTKRGAINAAKKYAKSIRRYKASIDNALEFEV